MKKLIGIVWLIFSISSCDLHQEVIAPPAKPEGVPELAFWIGGLEGWVFILISNEPEMVPILAPYISIKMVK